MLDPQFLQGQSKLRFLGTETRQLLFHRQCLVGGLEDTVAIGIDSDRKAMLLDHIREETEIACQVLRGLEPGRQDGTGGIIHRFQQHARLSPVFKPGMGAGIEVNQQAGLRFSRPGTMGFGGTAFACRSDPGGAQDSPHGGGTDPDALVLRQQFSKMMVVGSFIPFALVQLHDSVSQVFRQGMRRFSTPVLMYNPFFPLLKNPGFDPVHLTNAEPQQHSGFTSGDLLMKETLDDSQSFDFFSAHGNRLFSHN